MSEYRLNKTMRLGNRRTCIKLENEFWDALSEISRIEKITTKDLFSVIDKRRKNIGLTSAARIFSMSYFRNLSSKKKKKERIENAFHAINILEHED
jgi:predicted DNA-binding ribbon-helix-helix protein